MHAALERAMADLISGPALDPDDAAAVTAWLDRSGVSVADAAALRDGRLRRLLVYRDLARSTLRDVLTTMLPRTLARLGDAAFGESFDRFLRERGPRTHYLRDVTAEFVAFCVPLWRSDRGIAAYLGDLARFEALEFEIAAREDEPAPSAGDLVLDRPLRFVRACALVRFDHAVHELPAEAGDRSAPAARATALLGYRDREHAVRFLSLSPAAAAILDQLLAGATLRDAVASCAGAASGDVVDDLSRVLADLADRDILLGPR